MPVHPETPTFSKLSPGLRIVGGRRNREKGAAMIKNLGEKSEFVEVDINNVEKIKAALQGGLGFEGGVAGARGGLGAGRRQTEGGGVAGSGLGRLGVESAKRESKLGLKLTKTPSLVNLLSNALPTEKLKAANFPAMSLHIGPWMRVSRHEGELIAKCYFKKRQLVWEVLNGNLKSKIEFQWSNIAAINATFDADGGPAVLDVMLEKPPLFFREIKPQPRKHTNWEQSEDFTDKQASLIRKHKLVFAPGILEKHYFKIIQADSKLHHISQQPFPYQASIYFNEIHFSNQLCYNNLPAAIPPQIPTNHPSVMDFASHTTSANYPIHQDLSPNNNDLQFAISSSMSQESSARFQQAGLAYPYINDIPVTNDVELNPLGYLLPFDCLQPMDAVESCLQYMGDSSHHSSYDYEDSIADQHQSISHEYQSHQHYDFHNYNQEDINGLR
uniref:TRF2/HOY1 PH-like domain-containing protein n=1 Tax=Chenopodium quinoa TaxID=63459 RepID=A0A803KNR4_CHEQI